MRSRERLGAKRPQGSPPSCLCGWTSLRHAHLHECAARFFLSPSGKGYSRNFACSEFSLGGTSWRNFPLFPQNSSGIHRAMFSWSCGKDVRGRKMVGYGEELAARQGANVEASFGDLDADVSGPFGVREFHAASPSSSRRPGLASAGSCNIVAVIPVTVRAPPLEGGARTCAFRRSPKARGEIGMSRPHRLR